MSFFVYCTPRLCRGIFILRMVLESQAPQAVRQRQIAGIAVRTAQDMGVDIQTFAEPVAVVAARAGIPVEFVSESSLAPRQVGNIPPVSRLATSPQANVEHPTPLGKGGDVGNVPRAGLQSTARDAAAAGVTPSGAEASAPTPSSEGGKETVPSGQYAVETEAEATPQKVVDLSTDNVLAERIGTQHGSEKYKIIQEYILEQLGGKEIVFSDGRKAIVDRSDASHIAHKSADKKTAQISKIKELIETAQLYAEDSQVEHPKFDFFCYYQAMVQYDGEVFAVYLNVGRAKNDGQYHLYDITKKIRDTADRMNGLERPKPNEGYAIKNGVSMDSISENGENVNSKSQAPAAVMEGTGKDGNIFFGAMYDRENGKILINADAIKDGRITVGQTLDFFLKHELTHKIERTGAWNKLATIARREMGAEAFDAQVQAVQERRAADGDTVGGTPEGAKKEVVADWVGTNLFKKEFAAVMAKEYKGFANNLVLTFSGLRRGLAATEKGRQAARMKYAEQLYLKALAESAPDVTDEQIAAHLEEVLNRMAEDGQPTAENNNDDGVSGQFAVVSGEKVDSDNDSISVKQQIMQNMDFLRNQQSVDSIVISDITLKDAKQQAERVIKTIPEKIEVQGIGSIVTDEKRLKNGLRYIESVQDCMAYNAIQRVLKRGNVIHERADHKERRYSTFTIAAPVDFVNGDVVSKYIVGVVVREQGKKYYKMHRAVLIPVDSTMQNEKGSNARRSAALSKDKGGTTIDITSNTNVPQKANGVKNKSMQNGGENSPIAGQRAQMTPEIAAQLRKNQAEIDEKNPPVTAGATTPPFRQGGQAETVPSGQYAVAQSEIDDVQSIGRKSVNDFTSSDIQKTERFAQQYFAEMGVKSPFFRAWFGDWRAYDTTPVQVANQKGSARGVIQNVDTGWDIQVSGKVFSESQHFAHKNTSAVPYLLYVNDIVEKAVLLDSYGIDNKKSPNSLLMHSLYAVADIGNGPELLKLYVEEMNDPSKANTIKRSYQLQNIEKAFAVNGGVQSVSLSPLANTTNAIHTIADLVAVVKSKDARYQPHPVSQVVLNADGTPKVFYHGTNADFTEFVSKDGEYWFSESQDYAESMMEERGGTRLIPVYLRMVNPYVTSLPADQFSNPVYEKPIIRKAKADGYDGVIIKNDTDSEYAADTFAVAFDSTQIKSATDNIGTFDGNNPDIRYSQMTPEIAAQLQKNQAEIDERNRRRGIQKADAQAELDAAVDNDVDNDVDSDADVDLDAEDIVDLSSDNELAERIGAQRGAGKYKIIQEYILEQLGGQEIVFSDGRKAIVDRSDALHLANRAANKKTAQISKIKELIETAQLYAEDSQVEHTKFDYFCYYQAMVQYDGDVFPLYLNVGRAKNGGEYHLYDITNKLRDTADRTNGLERPKPNEGYALTNGVSMDSIFENGENVNGKFDLSTPEGLRAQAAALEKRAAQLELYAVKSIRLFSYHFLHKTS